MNNEQDELMKMFRTLLEDSGVEGILEEELLELVYQQAIESLYSTYSEEKQETIDWLEPRVKNDTQKSFVQMKLLDFARVALEMFDVPPVPEKFAEQHQQLKYAFEEIRDIHWEIIERLLSDQVDHEEIAELETELSEAEDWAAQIYDNMSQLFSVDDDDLDGMFEE